jgi:hypothetical protein
MNKNRFVKLILISLLVVIIIGMSSTVNAQGNKKQYFIVTDGVIDPESDYHHYIDTWTGQGLEERIITFEFYAIYKDTIVQSRSEGWKVGGVKAEFKVYDIDNDIFLYIHIYTGGHSKPKLSETVLWQVINGKDSTHDRVTSVLMSIESGKLSKTISLNIGGEDTISLPFSYTYSCRMWLM